MDYLELAKLKIYVFEVCIKTLETSKGRSHSRSNAHVTV